MVGETLRGGILISERMVILVMISFKRILDKSADDDDDDANGDDYDVDDSDH